MKTFQNDVLCFSHLRWTFVFQRPQHLMSRFAHNSRVFFVEEPVYDGERTELAITVCPRTGVRVVTPLLPENTDRARSPKLLRVLMQEMIIDHSIGNFAAWYYTPMALEFTEALDPVLTIYDCMDELSAFTNAPAAMIENEQTLFKRADLVFTGGASLFEAKCGKHERVHLFASSVDVAHFSKALTITEDPADQLDIPRPRIGYAGVIDERMDLKLIEYLADQRPEWQIVLVGPIVKIDPERLPRRANIHYLGLKKYEELPAYLAGWDAGLLPFAQNEATRFISPTKTPEYLAAGLPVISTPVRDVVRDYGENGLARIGSTDKEFLQCVEQQLEEGSRPEWRMGVHAFLSSHSWSRTWSAMERLMSRELMQGRRPLAKGPAVVKAPVFAPKTSAAHA